MKKGIICKIRFKAKYIISESNMHRKNFGFKYSFSFFLSSIIKKRKYKTRLKAIELCDKYLGYTIKRHINGDYTIPVIDDSQKNIFFFWAQGIDNLPYLQQQSLSLLRKFYNDYNIILIDLNNYKDYINLSSEIELFFKSGKITIQTFSDILRFNLLYKFGGVWCDTTILSFKRLPLFENIKKYGFWSINNHSDEKKNLWGKVYPVTYTTFFLACHKNNEIMAACVDFYNEYYKKYNHAIDYFMNDYILILCMKYKLNNNQLNNIPFENMNPFILSQYFSGKRRDYVGYDASPQKLNWRTVSNEELKKFIADKI